MKDSIKLVLLLFFLSSCLIIPKSRAQKVFKGLNKAEKLIEKGFIKKALTKIDIALKKKDCICGDCIYQAEKKASLLKFHAYSYLKKHQVARSYLDSIYWKVPEIDSLKFVSYQTEIGKEILSKNIDQGIEKANCSCKEEICYIEFPIKEKGMIIRIKMHPSESIHFLFNEKKEVALEKWKSNFKNSSLYKRIKEQSL